MRSMGDFMTENQTKFLELAKKAEALSEEQSKVREELDVVMKAMGPDSYLQDPETTLVYKIIKPQGTFMYYRDLDYKRTAKEGERGGTVLAKKEAEEQGFVLRK